MAIMVFPSISTPIASQMNLRDDANAKSLTFSALNVQVLTPFGFPFSAFSASFLIDNHHWTFGGFCLLETI